MPNRVFPRRNAPDTWYPAGVAGVLAHSLTLASGERVRVVESETGPVSANTALLLHGWGCNAFHFRRLLPALAAHGVRGIALDLRGHGLSHKPADSGAYTSAALTAFVHEVLDALGIEQVGFVGHSLGAAVALDMALAAPPRVHWLTLLNPVGLSRLSYAPLFSHVPVRYAERIPAAASRAVGFAALHLAYGGLGRPEAGDLEQYLFPTLLPGGRFGMLAYARAFSWEPRPEKAIAGIACPTRVLLGERDRVIRSSEAIERLKAVPQARVAVVERAGHVLAEEAPEVVADAVAELVRAERSPALRSSRSPD